MEFSGLTNIESCAADSVPPKLVEYYDGWRLRFNYGVTRRANSVLAEKSGTIELSQKLGYIESFYASHGVPARFQLNAASQPAGLEEMLLARAYTKAPGAKVQIANLNTLAVKKPKHKIKILNRANKTWLDIYEKVEQADEQKTLVRRGMLNKMPQSSAFVLVYINNKPAAVGLGVLIRKHLGIFNMATEPKMRKQGAARSVIYALANWANENAAERIYLQVTTGNTGAQKAYEKMGFVTAYEYDYFTKEVS